VTTDGPVTKASIYGLYRDGCPRVERAGKHLRQAINRALSALERIGQVQARDEGRRRLPDEVVYRTPHQPWVAPRPLGGRALEDVPLSELAAQLATASAGVRPDGASDLETLLKTIARTYGVLRFRDQARARLVAAAEIAFDAQRSAQLR
jgi:hypothetical protein